MKRLNKHWKFVCILVLLLIIVLLSIISTTKKEKCSIYQTFCFTGCNDLQKSKFRNATIWVADNVLNISKNKTTVKFIEINKKCDILVDCRLDKKGNNTTAEATLREFKDIIIFHKNATIWLYSYTKLCINNSVEKHELLHTFGLNHSFEQDDIMYKDTPCRDLILSDKTIRDIKNNFSC